MILTKKVLKELLKITDIKHHAPLRQHLHVSSNSTLATNGKVLLVISEDQKIDTDFKKVDVTELKSKMRLNNNVDLSAIANGNSNVGFLLEFFFNSDRSDCFVSDYVAIERKTKDPIYYDAKELLKVQNILTSLGWEMDNLEIISYNHGYKSISYKAKIDNYRVYFTVCGIHF